MLDKKYINFISQKLSIPDWKVENTIILIEEGATVPFISRYRKERTGGLDETQIGETRFHYYKFIEIDKRKKSIISSITEQGKLTDSLKNRIDECTDSQTLEDLYLPYKQKRRTRASIAKEKGLEPLAQKIYTANIKDVTATDEEVAGASDIMAEWISEDMQVRNMLRNQIMQYGKMISKLARGVDEESEEADRYSIYFDYHEQVCRAASHRILAMFRGSDEGILSIKIDLDSDKVESYIFNHIKGDKNLSDDINHILQNTITDAYKRLLFPSIENECLKKLKLKADNDSIRVFGENLRQLLLAPPLGQKRMLALDPGFRSGCKVVCLDSQGNLLHNDTIYPHPPKNERTMAMKKISNMVESYNIEVIAIGNGTAGRETDAFIKKLALPEGIQVYSVSEDGASVYSASKIARDEFPDYDVTVRGAVSIGRRIMDPLAELVKIDPKAIGVGQYQHDVDQTLLKERLDIVVESTVNKVGVNLNTASIHLLSYVSGIGPTIAKNIVDFRAENGAFTSKAELLKVKKLGPKIFEQAAGFLRIVQAKNPLDNSAIHPERYDLVTKMAKDLGISVTDLIKNKEVSDKIDINKYVTKEVGLYTLQDIMEELAKPGRDPRSSFKVLEFSDEIHCIDDLKEGMELPGIITNITNFGAFVDIGIHENGLIHISHMGKKFVRDPYEIVSIHQHVKVKVLSCDIKRNRIALELIS